MCFGMQYDKDGNVFRCAVSNRKKSVQGVPFKPCSSPEDDEDEVLLFNVVLKFSFTLFRIEEGFCVQRFCRAVRTLSNLGKLGKQADLR